MRSSSNRLAAGNEKALPMAYTVCPAGLLAQRVGLGRPSKTPTPRPQGNHPHAGCRQAGRARGVWLDICMLKAAPASVGDANGVGGSHQVFAAASGCRWPSGCAGGLGPAANDLAVKRRLYAFGLRPLMRQSVAWSSRPALHRRPPRSRSEEGPMSTVPSACWACPATFWMPPWHLVTASRWVLSEKQGARLPGPGC